MPTEKPARWGWGEHYPLSQEQQLDLLGLVHADLVAMTSGAPDDMHEPDQIGLSARVIGETLDINQGNEISAAAVEAGTQNYVVVLEKEGEVKRFNLASLIALARFAVLNPDRRNVFLVEAVNDDGPSYVAGVFSTLSKAQAFEKKHNIVHDDLTTFVKAAVIDEMDDAKVLKQNTKEGEHSEDYYVFEERIS